jgi:hypothetical protein
MKTLLLFVLVSLFPMLCAAQATSVKLLDLNVHPSTEIDSLTGLPVDTSIISFNLDFKVNNAANANQAKVLFGTTQNIGDVIDITATFSQVAGQYYLSYNGNSNVVTGYNARIKAGLTGTQEKTFHYITLYLLDNQGQETNRLYFIK